MAGRMNAKWLKRFHYRNLIMGESCVAIAFFVLFPPPSSQPLVDLVDTAVGNASRRFRYPLS